MLGNILLGNILCLSAALASSEPPNVVFLTVDTLRADYLGCYGYPYDTSPNIDLLAGQGLLFEDAVTEIPLTGPSFAAMLTSRFPRSTGVVRNGLAVPGDIPSAVEAFRGAGYHTFCVQSNWTLRAELWKLDRGFDVYDDDMRQRRWLFFYGERDAKAVADRAIQLFAERPAAQPVFAWVHFSDPHAPYKRHRRFHYNPRRYYRLDEIAQVRERYASEVGFTDYHIGRVLEALPENTYVLFVSDHGESLHEHDYLGHGRRIYQTCMRVPLIIHGPGIESGRTSAPARGIDIGPTLLGLAGLPLAPGMLGLDLLRNPPPQDRVRAVETYGGAVPRLPGAETLMAERPAMRSGVLYNGWKLILSSYSTELYNLRDDPMETENLADGHEARVEELRALLTAWETQHPRGNGLEPELSDEDLEALESMGYLD